MSEFFAGLSLAPRDEDDDAQKRGKEGKSHGLSLEFQPLDDTDAPHPDASASSAASWRLHEEPAPLAFNPDDEATCLAPPAMFQFHDEPATPTPPSSDTFDRESIRPSPPPTLAFDDEATCLAPPHSLVSDDEATVMAPTTRSTTSPVTASVTASVTRGGHTRAPLNYGDENTSLPTLTQLDPDGDGATEATRAREPINSDALPIGHMLMWYRIEQVLGQGGFGLTYRAKDTRLNNFVAIKEYLPTQLASRGTDGGIHPKGPDQEEPFIKGRERFLNEARTLARFKHPALVRVATFFEEANSAYMAMEFEEGESLGSVLKAKKTLEEPELLKIVMPLLQGLQALHAENIIHRDIKPDNIFIRKKDGTPVLLDFGSARKTDAGDNMTAMLTPSYAPMEQYFEDASRQGPWTDIYAMGAVMYRIISGRKPVGAPQRSNAIMRNQPDPLVAAVEVGIGRYSESLLKAIDVALAVVETDRPKTIQEWLKSVEVAMPEEELHGMERVMSKLPKDPKLKAAVIGVMLLTLGGLGYGAWSLISQAAGPPVLTQAEIQAQAMAALKAKADQGDVAAMREMAERHLKGDGFSKDLTVALNWYRQAAKQGDAVSRFELATAYASGNGVPKNEEKAAEYYEQAAQQGHPKAQARLAEVLENGHGIKADAAKALEWHEKAAKQGDANSQYKMGVAHETGSGMPKNDQTALTLYLAAADKGVAEAQFKAGLFFLSGRGTQADPAKAAQWLLNAAQKDIAEAQFQYAQLLTKGTGVEKNPKEAARWIFKAANLEHPEAQLQLAILFERGAGIRQDGIQSFKWYRKAADQGNLKAQLILAEMYRSGKGVDQNFQEATRMFEMAAKQGNAEAQNGLGTHYRFGLGPPKDAEQAIQWFQKAAEQDHPDAQYHLGAMYENGEGIKQDYAKAIEWYRKSATKGHTGALSSMGWMHEEGKGVAVNLNEAAKWYQKATLRGDARSQKNLAWMYEEGRGVKRNTPMAFALYTLAAAQKDKDAKRNITLITQDMTPEQLRKGAALVKQLDEIVQKFKELREKKHQTSPVSQAASSGNPVHKTP
ncbi:MAG: SEL1-like repeat protein [Magnetococcales bacterium]|nr:SEL1-like repeat protein [Magnetococcales bacterium]